MTRTAINKTLLLLGIALEASAIYCGLHYSHWYFTGAALGFYATFEALRELL